MKYLICSILLILTVSAMANDSEEIFSSHSELNKWCMKNSKFHLLENDKIAHNWTSSMVLKRNLLTVKGKWKVNQKRVLIFCSSLRQGKRKNAALFISGKEIGVYRKIARTLFINNEEDLAEWCRNESKRMYLAKGRTPYDWTYSHSNKNSHLYVEGVWKVRNIKKRVNCNIRRGSTELNAIIQNN